MIEHEMDSSWRREDLHALLPAACWSLKINGHHPSLQSKLATGTGSSTAAARFA
jgi:hypothetical protein